MYRFPSPTMEARFLKVPMVGKASRAGGAGIVGGVEGHQQGFAGWRGGRSERYEQGQGGLRGYFLTVPPPNFSEVWILKTVVGQTVVAEGNLYFQ